MSGPQPVPDHLRERLRVLFVGFNPSLRSGETGHHYANPSNRFWTALHESGLTSRKYRPEEDGDLLELGYGFANIVDRPTKSAEEIRPEEYAEGRTVLRAKIEHFRPRIVCLIGKGVYLAYSGRREASCGVQPEETVSGVTDFVAPSTSGLVRMRKDEMVAIYRELADLVRQLD